jgi:hypothetical protein
MAGAGCAGNVGDWMSDELSRNVTQNLAAQHVAEWYVRRGCYPAPYDRVLQVDGVLVDVIVKRHVRPDDTKPVFGVRDEDDRIAD